jgi:hypothetical protein
MAQARGLLQEHRVEGRRVDLVALEQRPGVGVGIGGVDRRMKSWGRPRWASNRRKASNGEVVNTPPKSQITASIAMPASNDCLTAR